MAIENKYTDIFTEFDETIFSDGSIDPMGLRIIWTSLGNAIFKNKLNTISTDIRYYTLNLFHHYVIDSVESENEDNVLGLISKSPYYNKRDLDDGIIIFLESLLTHIAFKINGDTYSDSSSDNYIVPGVSKLSSIFAEEKPEDARVKYLTVHRKAGILIRQILLGIHGRHKGPFQQMQIFNHNDYYGNKEVWNEAAKLFNKEPWISLAGKLKNLIEEHVLKGSVKNGQPIVVPVYLVINDNLKESYKGILKDTIYKSPELIKYWEYHLGLTEGTAKILYDELKIKISKVSGGELSNYELILKNTSQIGIANDNKYIKAICAIEPLIARIGKTANRLLKRGTSEIDEDLKGFVNQALNDNTINLHLIKDFLKEEYLSQEALVRLTRLYDIYAKGCDKKDAINFIHDLIDYHKGIMSTRGNMAWLSIGNNNRITQYRSFNYTDKFLKSLEDDRWVNDYYISTVYSLYKGLYQQ